MTATAACVTATAACVAATAARVTATAARVTATGACVTATGARGHLSPGLRRPIAEALGDSAPQFDLTADELADALQDTPPPGDPPPAVAIDYRDVLADDRARREAARDASRASGHGRPRTSSGASSQGFGRAGAQNGRSAAEQAARAEMIEFG